MTWTRRAGTGMAVRMCAAAVAAYLTFAASAPLLAQDTAPAPAAQEAVPSAPEAAPEAAIEAPPVAPNASPAESLFDAVREGAGAAAAPVGDQAPSDAPPAQDSPPEAQVGQDAAPVPVTIGVYINDIQDIDFKTNSYIVDLYMWFRWRGTDIDPIKSTEFMNIFDPESQQKTVLLDAPKAMPDGSLYNIVRYHGRFSKKFRLEKYPFDTQTLEFIVEDSVSPASEMVFVPDTRGMGINPALTLPGFRIGKAALNIADYTYPTDFGDLSAANAESYSRAVVSVPITRPMFTLSIKTFGPILLIVICATLVFYINPHFVEGRIGLAITALLTLVALQFTAGSTLPEADYFTMLDKLYMLSYGFIIASLLRVVLTSWRTQEGSAKDVAVSHGDHRWGFVLLAIYAVSAALIAGWVLTR